MKAVSEKHDYYEDYEPSHATKGATDTSSRPKADPAKQSAATSRLLQGRNYVVPNVQPSSIKKLVISSTD